MADDCQNPLLAGWLKERWEEARERNTKAAPTYKKAYQSMVKCDLKFQHASECQKLQGIGPKLADWLAEKMERYCLENGLPIPTKKRKDAKRRAELATLGEEAEEVPLDQPAKKQRKAKAYVPALRSGAYAIIKALASQADIERGMSKQDLQREAQPFCDPSFTVPSDPTKFYTAWKSIDTLLTKELVCQRGKPVTRYILTDEGLEVAAKIELSETGSVPSSLARAGTKATHRIIPHSLTDLTSNSRPNIASTRLDPYTIEDLTSSPEAHANSMSASARQETNKASLASNLRRKEPGTRPSFDPIRLPSGSFKLRLILDNREVRTVMDRDYISSELQKHGITPIIRPLELGDALWVAEIQPSYYEDFRTSNPDDEGDGMNEVVLDYITERKRLDDFISSIKDGRFHEQKFRLRRSGVKHVIYLIEEYSISAERSDKYGDALESATAGMQIVDGFFVKQTAKLDETVRYLANMTKSLAEKYENRELRVIPSRALDGQQYLSTINELRSKSPDLEHYVTFPAFTLMCTKSDSLTLRDVYLKMLMCTRGVTGEKAMEIQKKWPTPKALIDAFDSLRDVKAKESMISDQLGTLIPRKKIARGLSAKVAEIWA